MTAYRTSLQPGDSIEVTGSDLRVTPTTTLVTVSSPAVAPPPPVPDPPPAGGAFALIDRDRLRALPRTGPAYSAMKSRADGSTKPNLSDQNNQGDVATLAQALIAAASDDATYRDKAIANLKAARGTEKPGDSLGTARGLAALALAADLIDYREPSWRDWLAGMRTWENPDRGLDIVQMQEERPNNFGTHSSAARIAIDLYLGDKTDLERAAKVFRGWLGERASYTGFKFGPLSWQADSSKPVGINPKGATRSGFDLDGILPDDMRRGGTFPSVGSAGISYSWEALQGAALATLLLQRAGYDAHLWADKAILRAVTRLTKLAAATGDDLSTPWLVREIYGVTVGTLKTPTSPAKNFGYADWLFSA